MRRAIIMSALILLLFIAAEAPVCAEDDSSSGHVVALLPVINNSGLRGDHYTVDMVDDNLANKFGNGKYQVLFGQPLIDDLKKEGIDDLRTVDNATLLAALRRMHVDYCVRTELLFVVTDQKLTLPSALLFIKTWTATVPLYVNILDVNQGVAIYDATIVENGRHESLIGFAHQSVAVKNGLAKVLDRFDREASIPE